MYGYNDYNGPSSLRGDTSTKVQAPQEEEEEDDPLRVGQWLEGDSLGTFLFSSRKSFI